MTEEQSQAVKQLIMEVSVVVWSILLLYLIVRLYTKRKERKRDDEDSPFRPTKGRRLF